MQMAKRKIEKIIFHSISKVYGGRIHSSSFLRESVTLSKLENVDYQSNICFQIGKLVGAPPDEIAARVVNEINEPQILSEATASPPGFITSV